MNRDLLPWKKGAIKDARGQIGAPKVYRPHPVERLPVSDEMKAAGLRYHEDYVRGHQSPRYGSCDPSRIPGGGPVAEPRDAVEDAARRIHAARKALGGPGSSLVSVADAILGDEETVKNLAQKKGHNAARLSATLHCALEVLVAHYASVSSSRSKRL